VVDATQHLDKGSSNHVQFPERQVTIVELPLLEPVLHDFVDLTFNLLDGQGALLP